MNSRPIQATIHLPALRQNLTTVRTASGDAKVWAVVKANAYGHGLTRVFEGLRGADGFACLDLAEAQQLRDLQWRGPILLLEGAFNARDLELCSRLSLWHVIHCEQQIDWLAAHKTHEPHRVFLKMNTGMNRLGFRPQAYRAAYARLCALPQVSEVSHMTHFSDADTAKGVFAQTQLFDATVLDLEGERSLANSPATLHHSGTARDWVRAGIALYGSDACATQSSLLPVMSLQSRILSVQDVVAGETIGYGSSFAAPHAMRVGVVACGYADGYLRSAQGAPVLVDGRRCAVVGRISMDMLTVDLSAAPQSQIGSAVTLWGRAPTGQLLRIDEVAKAAGSISYELMCGIAARVPFVVED